MRTRPSWAALWGLVCFSGLRPCPDGRGGAGTKNFGKSFSQVVFRWYLLIGLRLQRNHALPDEMEDRMRQGKGWDFPDVVEFPVPADCTCEGAEECDACERVLAADEAERKAEAEAADRGAR